MCSSYVDDRAGSDEDKDDLLRHRLALAVCCLPEIAEPARSCNEPTINQICNRVVNLCRDRYSVSGRPAVAGDALHRALGAMAVVKAGEGESCLDLLADDLRDGRPRAIDLIIMAGAADATDRIVEGLLDQLRGLYRGASDAAAKALGGLGGLAASQAVEILLDHLEGRYPSWRAAEAVGQLGSTAATEPVVRALTRLIEDDADEDVRAAAANSLGRLSRAAAKPAVVGALTRQPKGDSPEHGTTVEKVSAALRKLGGAAAVPALVLTYISS